MVVCNVDNFKKICIFLNPKNQAKPTIRSDGCVESFGTAVIAVTKQVKKDQFLGSNAEEEAQIRQWIDYAVCHVNFIDASHIAHSILKDLNTVLAAETYLVGSSCTLADVVLYHLLYKSMSNLTFQEKEQYMHLSRWYNNLQQDSQLRGSNAQITFSRTPLYA